MATVSAPYATGTITSVTGTTVVLSGGAVAGWVNRCIRISTGAAVGQIRKITGYTSATQITVDFAWTTSPFSAQGFTEVAPSSGDTFVISHLIADIVDGTTIIADPGVLTYRFVGASAFSGGAFLYAANTRIDLTSSSITCNQPTVGARVCWRLGDVDAFGNVYNGCNLLDNATAPSGFGTGGAGTFDPDFHYYAGVIRCTGAAPFWRFHSDSAVLVRMVGLQADGNIGARIAGATSILKDWIVANNTSASGPFNPKSPFGLISNIKVVRSLQALYQFWPDSLTVEAESIKPDTTTTKLMRFANATPVGSATTGQTLTIKDVDLNVISAMSLLYTNSNASNSPNNTFRLSQYLNASYVSAAGAAITDNTRFVVRDNVPTTVYNSTVVTGTIPRQQLRYRDMTISSTGDRTWASAGGTTYAPYAVAAISYLYQPASLPLPLLTSQTVNLVALVDSYVTQTSKATVDAYTSINDLDKLYDRAKSWTVDNLANAVPSFGTQLITANGAELDIGAFNLTIDATAGSAFTVSGGTITINAATLANGTKFSAITTTGTVTLANGAGITVSKYTDSTGVNVGVSVSSLVSGSRIRIYNTTDAVEVANTVVAGTSYFQYLPYTANKNFTLRATYCNATTAYSEYSTGGTFGSNGVSFTGGQVLNAVYNANGVDGATCTEFAADYPNVQMDVSDPDGVTSLQRLYAWYCSEITSANGIRNFFGGMIATDRANYLIVSSIVNLKLDNVLPAPIVIVGGYLSRDDGATVIAATSGSIQMDPAKAYIANSASITASLARIEPNAGLIPALL